MLNQGALVARSSWLWSRGEMDLMAPSEGVVAGSIPAGTAIRLSSRTLVKVENLRYSVVAYDWRFALKPRHPQGAARGDL